MSLETQGELAQLAVFNNPPRHILILAAIGSMGIDPAEPFHSRQIHEMTTTPRNKAESFAWRRIQDLEAAAMVSRYPGRHGKNKAVLYERTNAAAWQVVETAIDAFGIKFPGRPETPRETIYIEDEVPDELAQEALFGHTRHLLVLSAISCFAPDRSDAFSNREINAMTLTQRNSSEAYPWKRIMALEKAGMVERLPGRQGKKIQYARLDSPAWGIIEKAIDVFGIAPPGRLTTGE